MLSFIALVASASALDVWSGSNNAVKSNSGVITGLQGLTFTDTPGGVLSADLEANAAIVGVGTGLAYSDWSEPLTTITRTRTLAAGETHDLSIVFGGHVQAGIQKTSVYGAGNALAVILASATPNVGSDSGQALIRSTLTMNGKSSGYAIADGTAAYSSSQKVGTTSNDLDKVTGSAIGKVDIRGDTNAATDAAVVGGADRSNMAAAAEIKTTSNAGTLTATATSNSHVQTDFNGVNQFGNANTTIAVPNGQATSSAWDGTSSSSKTADNANALTSVTAPIAITMTTWNEDTSSLLLTRDNAVVDQAGISATANPGSATSTVASSAKVQRVVSTSTNKVTAEAFIRGGTWNAASRSNEFNLLQATGALGGAFDGIASGAHLVNPSGAPSVPISIGSSLTLTQTATNGAVRTDAQLTKGTVTSNAVVGPQFTGNILDDAGSYFSTTGYTTTSTINPGIPTTFQTNVGASSDIKWLQGLDPSANIYTNGFGVTSTGIFSSTMTTNYALGTDPRTEDINFRFTQA